MKSSRSSVLIWILVVFNALFFTAAALVPRRVPPRAWLVPALANVALGLWMSRSRRVLEDEAVAQQPIEWPVILFTLDARGRIFNCNAQARALFGLGEGGETTLPQVVHPDEEALNTRLLALMGNGTARDCTQERRCFGRGGTMFQALWHLRFFEPRPGAQQSATVLVEDISTLRTLEAQLSRSQQSLHDLHEIVAGQQLEEQVRALLELGRRRFGVETGFVAQRREGKLRLLEVRSEDPRLRRNTGYSLSETKVEGPLCRPLGPRGLAHAPFESDPNKVYLPSLEPVFIHQGETYMGAPIVAEGVVWGGLHFSDAEGRAAIEDEDKRFLGSMAAWLGGEIERRQIRARLEEQQKELLEAAIQLENLAVRDGLTGAKNRRAFDEHLRTEWLRSRRYKTPLSLVLLDVDKFKSFNDTFGHPAGDEVLKKVAQVLGDSIRNIDFLARYGGEEFVLLLPNTDASGALIVADRLREQLQEAQWLLRPVTASFGVATLSAQMEAPKSLLQAADEALYCSKEAGRNRVTHAQDVAASASA